MKLDFYFFN